MNETNSQNETSSESLEPFSLLPNEIHEKIIFFLCSLDLSAKPGDTLHGLKSVTNLSKTSQFWRSQVLKLWRGVLLDSFGTNYRSILEAKEREKGSELVTQREYIETYLAIFSSFIIKGNKITGSWVGDSRYYTITTEDGNEQCLKLKNVWWLSIGTSFKSVIPGTYEIIWRLKILKVLHSYVNLLIRVKGEDEKVEQSTNSSLDLKSQQIGVWVDISFGKITLNRTRKIECEFQDIDSGSLKSGIIFQEVRLERCLVTHES